MSSLCQCQVLGCAALFGTILPVVELPFSAKVQAHSYARDLKIPFLKVRARGSHLCSEGAGARSASQHGDGLSHRQTSSLVSGSRPSCDSAIAKNPEGASVECNGSPAW
jgi:hypothetical protein